MANRLVRFFWSQIVTKSDAKRKAAQRPPAGVEENNDIAYISDGHRHHLLDVYRPENVKGALPVIVDIHGGGWYYGDKELNKYYCMSLVRHGFAVVNISYRLAPEVGITEQISDCFAAINFAYENAEKYGLDRNNMFITGDSAGGHLAALILNILAKDKLKQTFSVESSASFKAACFTCPALEAGHIAEKPMFGAYFNAIFGKGYRKSELIKHVNFSDDVSENLCPCFFITAYADMMRKQTVDGYNLVKCMGGEAEIVNYDKPIVQGHKLEHVFNILNPEWEESVKANAAMCDFFKKYVN